MHSSSAFRLGVHSARTRKELDEHLETPILRSFWARRLDLLEEDVDIQFITMLSDPD
jgi:hypothetical protein